MCHPRVQESSRVRLPKKGQAVEPPRVSWWIGRSRDKFSEVCAREARPLVENLRLKIWTQE